MLRAAKGTILVVDDEPDICELLQGELEDRGFAVKTALCVNDGMDVLANSGADVIVSDMRMPGKTGLDFLIEVNKREQRPTFLFMSGYSDVSVQELFQLGAAGLYSKPLDFERLARQIEDLTHKLKENFGSRQSSRTATEIPAKVSYVDTGVAFKAKIKNISRGGACFQVFDGGLLPGIGERVQFVFHDIHSCQPPVRGVGTCKWSEGSGLGGEIDKTSTHALATKSGLPYEGRARSFGMEFCEIAPECFYAFFQQISSVLSVPAPKLARITKTGNE